MKDEIKEILDLLNFNRDTISNGICRVEDFMSREQIIKLLDYITNLQEERNNMACLVNELQEDKEDLQEENKILNLELSGYRQAILNDDKLLGLKSRIDKAIKYIKETIEENLDWEIYRENVLLNILQGEDK